MKKIIKGKLYDTEKAIEICSENSYDNGNLIAVYTVYKTKKGAFLYEVWGNPRQYNAPDSCLEVISEEKAKELCEEFGTAEQYASQWEVEEA